MGNSLETYVAEMNTPQLKAIIKMHDWEPGVNAIFPGTTHKKIRDAYAFFYINQCRIELKKRNA